MNTKLIIGIVVAVLVVGGGAVALSTQHVSQPVSSQPAANPTSEPVVSGNTVTIQNFAFSPASLTVKVGTTVTWTNQDTAGHSATADNGTFDTGILSQGKNGSFTFTKAGTYTYHCSVHPTMHGTITVQ